MSKDRYYWRCDKCNSLIKGKNYHEITEKDLGPDIRIRIQGKVFRGHMIFGGLRSFDVGKRLYLVNEILYIENDEQYKKRIKT